MSQWDRTNDSLPTVWKMLSNLRVWMSRESDYNSLQYIHFCIWALWGWHWSPFHLLTLELCGSHCTDRLWSVPWAFLARIICNDSRDDSMVKNLIVESIEDVRFLESFWTFNRCDRLWPVFNDHVLVNDGQVQKYYIIMTHWTGSTHSIFGWRRDHSISLSTSHLFIVWKHSIIVNFNMWLLVLLTISG